MSGSESIQPDQLVAAVLSDEVYHSQLTLSGGVTAAGVPFAGPTVPVIIDPPPGWELITKVPPFYDPSTAYYGEAWGKVTSTPGVYSEIIVVNRGTTFSQPGSDSFLSNPSYPDGISTLEDAYPYGNTIDPTGDFWQTAGADATIVASSLTANLVSVFFGHPKVPAIVTSGNDFYESVSKAFPGVPIIETGQSLGGAIADAVVAANLLDPKTANLAAPVGTLSAVTFNALPYSYSFTKVASANYATVNAFVTNYYVGNEILTQRTPANWWVFSSPVGSTQTVTGFDSLPAGRVILPALATNGPSILNPVTIHNPDSAVAAMFESLYHTPGVSAATIADAVTLLSGEYSSTQTRPATIQNILNLAPTWPTGGAAASPAADPAQETTQPNYDESVTEEYPPSETANSPQVFVTVPTNGLKDIGSITVSPIQPSVASGGVSETETDVYNTAGKLIAIEQTTGFSDGSYMVDALNPSTRSLLETYSYAADGTEDEQIFATGQLQTDISVSPTSVLTVKQYQGDPTLLSDSTIDLGSAVVTSITEDADGSVLTELNYGATSTSGGTDVGLVAGSNGSFDIIDGSGEQGTSGQIIDFASGGISDDTLAIAQSAAGTIGVTVDVEPGTATDVSSDENLADVQEDFAFTGADETLETGDAGAVTGTISDFGSGDTIDLPGDSIATSVTAGASAVLTLAGTAFDGDSDDLHVDLGQNSTGLSLNYSSDGNGGIDVTVGTQVATSAAGRITSTINADGSMTIPFGGTTVAVAASDTMTIDVVGSKNYLIDVYDPDGNLVEEISEESDGTNILTNFSTTAGNVDTGVVQVTNEDVEEADGGSIIFTATYFGDPVASVLDAVTPYSGPDGTGTILDVPIDVSYGEYEWLGGDGDFSDPNSWYVPGANDLIGPPGPPGSAADVYFMKSGVASGMGNVYTIVVEDGADAVLTGSVETYTVIIANDSELEIQGSLLIAGDVEDAGGERDGGNGDLVTSEGNAGTLTVSGLLDGPGAIIEIDSLSVDGDGVVVARTLNIDGISNVGTGGMISLAALEIGGGGTLTIDGADSLVSVDDVVTVGTDTDFYDTPGSGTVIVSDQGQLDVTPGTDYDGGIYLGSDYDPNDMDIGNLTIKTGASVSAAFIDAYLSSSIVVEGAGSQLDVSSIQVTAAGLGGGSVVDPPSLSVLSGGTASGQLTMGFGGGVSSVAEGNVTVDGSGSLLDAQGVIIIYGGTLTVSDLATVDLGEVPQDVSEQGLDLNEQFIGIGISDETNNASTSSLIVESGGTLIAEDASTGIVNDVIFGGETGDDGTGTVTGAGSELNVGNFDLIVGSDGSGTLAVSDGAAVDAGEIDIAQDAESQGTVTVDGTNSLLFGTTLEVGGSSSGPGGSGTLTISNGGTVNSGEIDIAQDVGSQGTVTVDGTNSLLLGTTLEVGGSSSGSGGSGNLIIVNDGTVNAGEIDIAQDAGSVGTVTVNGTNSLLSGTTLEVGGSSGGLGGSGILTIGDGGTVSVSDVEVWSTGSVTLANGQLDTDPITILAGGVISGSGVVTGDITNGGTIIASGGTLELTDEITGPGTLVIGSGGVLLLDGTIDPGVVVDFASAGKGTLELADPTDMQGTIEGKVAGDQVVNVTCYVKGARIQAAASEPPVERLIVGDRVWTRTGGLASIKWIGHRRVDCRRHPQPQNVWPVRVRAGAFDDQTPRRDLWLSPDHAVFADQVLIPIKHLINGTSVEQVPVDEVTYYHIELPRHDVVLAEGMPAESYLDVGDRSNFANGGGLTAMHPDFALDEACEAIWETAGCAPLRIEGEALDRVAARLRERAGLLGWGPAPQDKPCSAECSVAATDLLQLLNSDCYLADNPDVAAAGVDAATHYVNWGRQEGRLPCREADLIRGLGLIDSATVIFTMADVVAAGLDLAEHFCTLGWSERRRPNPYFDTGWYLDTHDVPAGMNPLLHYVLLGEPRGLAPGPHFDPVWYRQRYAIGPTESSLAHFLAHRRSQQFSPLPTFDVAHYIQEHAATLRPDRDPYAHFLAIGRFVQTGTDQAARLAA